MQFEHEIIGYLEDSVIAVLPHKSQEVDTPGVHQLIVGRSRHPASCLRNARNHTLAVHLQVQKYIREIRKVFGVSQTIVMIFFFFYRANTESTAICDSCCFRLKNIYIRKDMATLPPRPPTLKLEVHRIFEKSLPRSTAIGNSS